MPKPSHKTARRKRPRERRAKTRLSRQVTLRMKDAEALVASIRAHKAAVAAAQRRRLEPALREGEALPDHELTLELRARAVEAAIDRLVKLDDRLDLAEASRAHTAREVDRLAKKELYPRAVDVRREIDAAFGRKDGPLLHPFRGKTTRSPRSLLLLVQRLLLRLADPNRRLPSHTARGKVVDREGWIRQLEKPFKKLADADEDLRRLTGQATNARRDRDEAIDAYDALYADALRIVEAEFREAGLGERVVNELRPYYQRRRLRRRARKKREIRAGRDAAAAPVAVESARPREGAPPEEEKREPQEGAVATVSRWLRKTRVLG